LDVKGREKKTKETKGGRSEIHREIIRRKGSRQVQEEGKSSSEKEGNKIKFVESEMGGRGGNTGKKGKKNLVRFRSEAGRKNAREEVDTRTAKKHAAPLVREPSARITVMDLEKGALVGGGGGGVVPGSGKMGIFKNFHRGGKRLRGSEKRSPCVAGG